jgi:hypothetical protein
MKRLIIVVALLTDGCVASKVERLGEYTPNPSRPPFLDQSAVEEYCFLSWEPYHFICTLGILPQYHYAVYEKTPGEFEKHSTMIGWIAIPLPLFSSWKYGHIPDERKPNQALHGTAGGRSDASPSVP